MTHSTAQACQRNTEQKPLSKSNKNRFLHPNAFASSYMYRTFRPAIVRPEYKVLLKCVWMNVTQTILRQQFT